MGLANAGKNRKNNKPNPPAFEDAGNVNTAPEAGTEVKPEPDNNITTDTNTNVSTNDSTNDSVFNIIKAITEVPKPIKKKQISVYIDEDVAREFDKFAKKYGKGAKSDLFNQFLIKVLNIKR